MTKYHPTSTAPSKQRHDYLPAAGRDALLPFYDLFTAALGAAAIHRTLIEQAELTAGQRVLEIGCGTGNVAIRVKRTHPGVELVGSDPDPLALARARRKARGLNGIRFERGYAQRLPHPDGSFDRVLSALMLHHLDHDTRVAAAAEVVRVLRPGGSLHLVDFAGHKHGIHGLLARRMVKSGHLADNQGDGIPRMLNAAGLDCAEVASRRHPVMGQITYYRALRPA
ncbi:class I SAM-dependent methyltransferase [Kutzneria kofuensis]|uniref:Ubiquinone/menaquinone biosynthesis C-methylase UbiE n=1 Tax=Kutzneria kofuensis TaxID=103725 RepID=A0A7W9NLI8_9PSEU|nr:class I SAM-dependent methyltransferase [Kutzneria kofuensis]MBB5896511.1 ubiquinone/menaquinone biosynthesis C-methylase UbiE [Kutzneria kofuensis]